MRNFFLALVAFVLLSTSNSIYAQVVVEEPSQSTLVPMELTFGTVSSSVADGSYECLITFEDGSTLSLNAIVMDGLAIGEFPKTLHWSADSDLLAELHHQVSGAFAGFAFFAPNAAINAGPGRIVADCLDSRSADAHSRW